jgi:hypothetical protein
VPFCCKRCKSKNIWFLLGVGKLVVEKGTGCTEMEKAFCHDKDCQLDAIRKMPVADVFVVNFDFDEILGATHNGVVEKTSAFCFHDKGQPAPPGHPINFGCKDCNSDGRRHEHLPSARCQELSTHQRRMGMVRFFFLLTACLNTLVTRNSGAVTFWEAWAPPCAYKLLCLLPCACWEVWSPNWCHTSLNQCKS